MNYSSRVKENHIREYNRKKAIRRRIDNRLACKSNPVYIAAERIKYAFLVFAVFSVVTLAFSLSSSMIASAKEETVEAKEKYYTTVEIKSGDTLTSIANEYVSEEYSDINEYIDEVKELNNLCDDTIHSGRYLKIAYYR